MTTRVMTMASLPDSLEPSLAALDWLDNDPPLGAAVLRSARRAGAPLADYIGVVAVDRHEIVARVGVERPLLTTSEGTERFCAITSVATRPDALRRGLARSLLREVHRRESAEGPRWSLLWTHRTWGAHRLYEQLGYRDVYSPPSALRRIPVRGGHRLARPFALRSANASDAGLLGGILRRATSERLGFLPRHRGSFELRFRLGWRRPQDHHILLEGRRPVGFVHAAQTPRAVLVLEAVVEDPGHATRMLDAVERLARGRWLAFGRTTFVNDAAAALAERGYDRFPRSHTTLMARRLGPHRARDAAAWPRLVADPRFSCHGGDMF